eukprot:scaffold14521_cov121-Isochrysis_galbana.AAC.2
MIDPPIDDTQAREPDAPGTNDAKQRAPVHGHTGAVPPDKALSDSLPRWRSRERCDARRPDDDDDGRRAEPSAGSKPPPRVGVGGREPVPPAPLSFSSSQLELPHRETRHATCVVGSPSEARSERQHRRRAACRAPRDGGALGDWSHRGLHGWDSTYFWVS